MKTDATLDPVPRMPDPPRRVTAVAEATVRGADPTRAAADRAARRVREVSEAGADMGTLATRAARELFAGREVDVQSFRDEATGRMVYRVTDRRSGEVLTQTPPDELLRLYAALRQPPDGPLLRVEA